MIAEPRESPLHQLRVGAGIERAMIEIGKHGKAAAGYTDPVAVGSRSEARLVRQSTLLAMPHIAPLPCHVCEVALQASLHGEHRAAIADLQLETEIVLEYFRWAGKK